MKVMSRVARVCHSVVGHNPQFSSVLLYVHRDHKTETRNVITSPKGCQIEILYVIPWDRGRRDGDEGVRSLASQSSPSGLT